ncbi:putative outer membrane efflux lipoprotein [Salmonella enterica subsp. enterica]|nr:putative outer membrane efflux lipoprotein [Salmonella enterica subsp. enterica]
MLKPPGRYTVFSHAEMLPTLGIATAMDAGRTPADLSVTDEPETNRRYEAAGGDDGLGTGSLGASAKP